MWLHRAGHNGRGDGEVPDQGGSERGRLEPLLRQVARLARRGAPNAASRCCTGRTPEPSWPAQSSAALAMHPTVPDRSSHHGPTLTPQAGSDRVTIAKTPADVVSMCDVTYCMLSTPEAVKCVYEMDQGVEAVSPQPTFSHLSRPAHISANVSSQRVSAQPIFPIRHAPGFP